MTDQNASEVDVSTVREVVPGSMKTGACPAMSSSTGDDAAWGDMQTNRNAVARTIEYGAEPRMLNLSLLSDD
jgi:hypothetical protein